MNAAMFINMLCGITFLRSIRPGDFVVQNVYGAYLALQPLLVICEGAHRTQPNTRGVVAEIDSSWRRRDEEKITNPLISYMLLTFLQQPRRSSSCDYQTCTQISRINEDREESLKCRG